MSLQNRSRPDGEIVADDWRGDLMGNRGGQIHDPASKTLLKRRWASKRWILCVLQFKQRRRNVMGNSYTELFFLDEVSGLACGHRPCFECQRATANQFLQNWEVSFGKIIGSKADGMDTVLHAQRLSASAEIKFAQLGDLPFGSMVIQSGAMMAKHQNGWLTWAGSGYKRGAMKEESDKIFMLTPPATLETLRAGYQPSWHKSASEV